MLKVLRDIKLGLIMDALISKEIKISDSSKVNKNYKENNNLKYGMYNKSKKKVKIRK